MTCARRNAEVLGFSLPYGRVSAGVVNRWAEENVGNWPIHCAGLFVRTAAVRAIGGWAGILNDHDIVMVAGLSETADGYNESSTTWLYRQHASQVTKSDGRRRWSESARRIALQRAASVRAGGLRFDTERATDAVLDPNAIEVGGLKEQGWTGGPVSS